MKQRLFICMTILIMMTISNSAFSQGVWGVEAGVNVANIKGDDISDETENRTGLLLAVYYQHVLANSGIILQPEIIYSQKGLEFGDTVVKVDYIVVAALAAYYFDVSEQVSPFVKAGPYLGLNVTAKQERDGDEGDLESVNSTDAGVIIRAGVQIDRFEIGARLSKGLTDVFDDAEGKNSVFGIFVGVRL